MKIDEKEIEHLAELSRIKLKDEEKKALAKDAEEIVGFFDEIKEVKIEDNNEKEGFNVSEAVLDEEREDRGTDEEKKQFLEEKDGYLKIPKVFE